jgi:hypothetical protein
MAVKKSPEMVERAKALKAIKWGNRKIADELNVDEKTIRRWLAEPDPPGLEGALAEVRQQYIERYVKESWEIILQLNEIIRQKIARGEEAFANAKDAATVMGIYVDKTMALESKGKGKGGERAPININIMPPDSGRTTTVIADPISVYDESEEIYGDDSGSGLGENILRLPAGDDNGNGEPG